MATLVLVEAEVIPERLDHLQGMLKAGLQDTRKFPGCIDLTAYTNLDSGTHFVMVEHWESKADYLKYYQWREDAGVIDQLQACFVGKPSIRFFDALDV